MRRKVVAASRVVGGRVRELRKLRGLRQRQLAAALKTDVPTVSRIETGKKDLRIPDLQPLAKALQVAPTELISPLDHESSLPRSGP